MNGLLDFLQGASNAAASNVSGPVDLIGMGLRKLGVPVPHNALLSSQWMEERGLTRKPKNALAAMAGETAGLLSPVVAAAKAPQIARGLLDTADDFQRYNQALGPAGASQAIVWHGSKDPRWIDAGEQFSASVPAANMPSKFMWVNPKKQIAEQYAGISETQQWKAANGLGPAPAPTAGVRRLDLADDAKILKVKDVQKSAQQLGTRWGGPQPLEDLLDAARDAGYDAVQMVMDGGNIAVLNPTKLTTKMARAAKAAP